MASFQFSYRIGLLFPSDQIFFGMIFVKERGLNVINDKILWMKV